MADLTGKIVLITAAAQGIGRASAEALARAGAKVVATDVNAERLRDLDGIDGIATRVLDVLSSEAVNRAVAEIGRIDVLFNCAGVVHSGSVLDMPDSDLDFALDLNVRAQIRAIKAVLPQMLERRDGCIINMSSVASSITAVPNRAAYSISKAAVIGLTKSLAGDYTDKGIRVNAIAPGHGREPEPARALEGDRRLRGGAQGLYRPPADRPHRPARGDRRSCRPSRRRDLYDRSGLRDRRRLDRLRRQGRACRPAG